MRISDWSSDVCSSDLGEVLRNELRVQVVEAAAIRPDRVIYLRRPLESTIDDVNPIIVERPRGFEDVPGIGHLLTVIASDHVANGVPEIPGAVVTMPRRGLGSRYLGPVHRHLVLERDRAPVKRLVEYPDPRGDRKSTRLKSSH